MSKKEQDIIRSGFSIFFGITAFMDLLDIFSGGESLVNELIIVFLALNWFYYLYTHKKPTLYLYAFYLFLFTLVVHNVYVNFFLSPQPVLLLVSMLAFISSLILLPIELTFNLIRAHGHLRQVKKKK